MTDNLSCADNGVKFFCHRVSGAPPGRTGCGAALWPVAWGGRGIMLQFLGLGMNLTRIAAETI